MAFSLSRNCTLIVSTVASSWDGVSGQGNALNDVDTFEIPVLDGFSFSQGNQTQNITVNEAGASPKRGQQIFNTALDPVDFSFTTYIRPFTDTNNAAKHSCTEKLLWNALVAAQTDTAENGTYGITSSTTSMIVDLESSDVHQLDQLNYYFYFSDSGLCYKVSNGVLTSADVDFSIDGLAQITWTGQGDNLTEVGSTRPTTAGTGYVAAPSTADFINNKLSTCALGLNLDGTAGHVSAISTPTTAGSGYTSAPTVTITSSSGSGATATATITSGAVTGVTVTSGGSGYTSAPGISFSAPPSGTTATGSTATVTSSAKTYNLAITGGSFTLDNGITWLTPEELGVINTPETHYTGSRTVSGSLTCYLTSGGTADSEEFMNDFLADVSSSNPDTTVDGTMSLKIGGQTASTPRVYLDMEHAHFTIPTVDVADVVSLTIEFTGLESSAFSAADEATITYYGKTAVSI